MVALLKGVGSRIFRKLVHLGGRGGTKVFARKGDKPEKGVVDVEMGGGRLPLFYYFTVQQHIYCV